MLRQRLRADTSPLAFIGRLLTFVLACLLLWYGLMLAWLALGGPPGTIDAISGYRTAYDALAGLGKDDLSDLARAIAAGVGLLAFLVFGYLAYKELPRPYLTRHDLELAADERGTVEVAPRAIERVAETAALSHPSVASATGRYATDYLAVGITVRRARDVAETLEDAQRRVVEALGTHDLPLLPVHLTLTGFDRRTRRELA